MDNSKKLSRETQGAYRWYASPDITWSRALMVGMVPIVCALIFAATPWGANLQRPTEFQFRHWVKRDPPVDSRMRIYAFDDDTVNLLKAEDLSLEEWGEVFKSFAPSTPRAIFTNKVFATPRGMPEAADFVRELRALDYPVIAGAFGSDSPIPGRNELSYNPDDYNLSKVMRTPDWLEQTQSFHYVYGPASPIEPAFSHIGHLQYRDYFVPSFIRSSKQSNETIPSASLFTAKRREIVDGHLFLDSGPVPLDETGQILVNLAHPTTYFPRTFSLVNVIKKIREGKVYDDLPKDTVVVILADFYTGAADRVPTPFGSQSGGYAMTALVNSVLTGNWLKTVPHTWLFVTGFGLLGIACALFFSDILFFVATGVGFTLSLGSGLVVFSWLGVEVPWLFSSLSLSSAALITFAERTRSAGNKIRHLRQALEGSYSLAKLNEILKHPSQLDLQPTGKVLTIMFVDIVGFSLASESHNAQDVFSHLRSLMRRLGHTVQEYGGVVDKTLGDGLMCFFGYSFDGTEAAENHAEQALSCAVKIQQDNARHNIAAFENAEPVYPLRIGLNTAQVYVGDLGSTRNIDLTVIGPGVNLAKRLEEACESHSIMMGWGTYDLLKSSGWNRQKLYTRYMQIKHHKDFVEAYECDALAEIPDVRAGAMTAYKNFSGAFRKDERWIIPPSSCLKVITNKGEGLATNYSRSGFSVELDCFLAVGSEISLMLDTPDGNLRKRLDSLRLIPMTCQVRWGRPVENGHFLHGLMITNLNHEQQQLAANEIRRCLAESGTKVEAA